jgi:integrin beta 3
MKPRYTIWEAISVSVALGTRALEEIRALARLPGPAGKDGQDGLGVEDMDCEYDGHRTVTVRFARGDVQKSFTFVIPVPIYRGVYREADSYQRGDMATFGGSLWHCNADTGDKPGDGSPVWTLAAKRGRDAQRVKI